MLTQILKMMTPDLIIQAVKDNPKLILETLHKFETFKLLGKSLNTEQQITLSNNFKLINPFLESREGSDAMSILVGEFTDFVASIKDKEAKVIALAKEEADAKFKAIEDIRLADIAIVNAAIKASEDAKMLAKAELDARIDLESRIRKEIEQRIRDEALANLKAADEARASAKATKPVLVPV